MRVIYKTKLAPWEFERSTRALLPKGAKPIALQLQHGQPTVWWLCDKAEPLTGVEVVVVGTGELFDLPTHGYIGTWQDDGMVWHAFQKNT